MGNGLHALHVVSLADETRSAAKLDFAPIPDDLRQASVGCAEDHVHVACGDAEICYLVIRQADFHFSASA
jgi:hypothetical protein